MSRPPGQEVGCYVLANDNYVEWLIAFLESFRAFNPEMPLSVIPFDGKMRLVRELAERYRFAISDDESLEALDDLAHALGSDRRRIGMMRKFASFWGPFDRFLLADADTLVLTDANELIASVSKPDIRLAYAMATHPGAVYQPGRLRDRTAAAQRAYINAGAWCSHRGLFDLNMLSELLKEAGDSTAEFAEGTDQAFLNYCLLERATPIGDWRTSPAAIDCFWPGQRETPTIDRGTATASLRDPEDPSLRYGMAHWAGFPLTAAMPYRRFWASYRYRGAPPPARLGRGVVDPLLSLATRGLRGFRRPGRGTR